MGLFRRAVLMHIEGRVLWLVPRLVSSSALEESHPTLPRDPAASRMSGDVSLVRTSVHHCVDSRSVARHHPRQGRGLCAALSSL